jgi:hypothetical protein
MTISKALAKLAESRSSSFFARYRVLASGVRVLSSEYARITCWDRWEGREVTIGVYSND